MRLDKALAARGLCRSRAEAARVITLGGVLVSGRPAEKASQPVGDDEILDVSSAPCPFVSRGGLKLAAALDAFDISVAGRVCLDVGASTGGFTDCLLQRGARHVFAVDVGHDQIHPTLAADSRVTLREGINARFLSPADFPALFAIAVADVSFISLTLILPALAPLLTKNGAAIVLVKPQFEVGVGNLGKNGIVENGSARADALENVAAAAKSAGLTERGRIVSPIRGTHGNQEFLLWLENDAGTDKADTE